MKKVLSILLSVMLILGTVTCLMLLPATADTGTTAPVNLIVNGDFNGVDGKQEYTEDDENKSTYAGEYKKGTPVGWRVYHDKDRNANLVWQNVWKCGTYSCVAPGMQVNRWQLAGQDITLESGKTYAVSAMVTTHVREAETKPTATINMFIDAGTGVEKMTAPKNVDWIASTTLDYVDGGAKTEDSATHYWWHDFVKLSFVFNADDFASANSLIATDGKYNARLTFENYCDVYMAIDDVTMYEVYTITAGEGGTVDTDAVICGTTATIKATPYYGNTFMGWYNGDTLVSSDATYTGVINANLTAKFEVYNLIDNGDFENTSVHDSQIAEMNGYKKYATSHGTPEIVSTSGLANTGDEYGDYALKLTPHQQTDNVPGKSKALINIPVTIKKNTDYIWRFSYKYDDDVAYNSEKHFLRIAIDPKTLSWTNGDDSHTYSLKYTFHSQPSGMEKVSDNDWSWGGGTYGKNAYFEDKNSNQSKKWQDFYIMFNAGAESLIFADGNDTATVYLTLGTNPATTDFVLIDNMSVTEAVLNSEGGITAENGTVDGYRLSDDYYCYTTVARGSGSYAACDFKNIYTPKMYVPVTASQPDLGYVFDGWYDESGKLISTNVTENILLTEKTTAKYKKANYNDAGVGDFEKEVGISGIVSVTNPDVSVSYGTYTAEDKALSGYTESMGDKYLLVEKKSTTGYFDISLPLEITSGKKYLAHLKMRTIANNATAKVKTEKVDGVDTEVTDENGEKVYVIDGNRIDVHVLGENRYNAWDNATGFSGSMLFSRESGETYSNSSKQLYIGNWFGEHAPGGVDRFTDFYSDLYIYIDAQNMSTGTVYASIGMKEGATYAIDNISFVELDSIAPTMEGASLKVEETADKVVYKTSVNLPEYLAMSKVSTYMIPTRTLTDENKTTFNAETANVGVASVSATDKVLTENGNTFRTGDVYATFSGASEVTQTNNYSARSEVELTDNYGNSLGITLSTGNTDAEKNVTNGVHKRSIQQLKRVLAKSYIEKGDSYATLAAEKITSHTDANKLYNGDITQVWEFVRAAYAQEINK